MHKHVLPSPQYLWKRLKYEPSTGKLFWRAYPPNGELWNRVWPGKEALAAPHNSGYRCGTLDYCGYQSHRVIWAMVTGKWPPEEIDHIDHDKTNNRIRNLRKADDTQNAKNHSLRKDSTTGIVGVRYHKRDNLWQARVGQKSLGYFKRREDAIEARRAAESVHGFHPNHGKTNL